jgi:hypothetical protein
MILGGDPLMTETDDLNRDIKALKELLKIAWQDLASKSLTPYEFREKRNEMDRCAAELRGLLNALEAERRQSRARFQAQSEPRVVRLRLLA